MFVEPLRVPGATHRLCDKTRNSECLTTLHAGADEKQMRKKFRFPMLTLQPRCGPQSFTGTRSGGLKVLSLDKHVTYSILNPARVTGWSPHARSAFCSKCWSFGIERFKAIWWKVEGRYMLHLYLYIGDIWYIYLIYHRCISYTPMHLYHHSTDINLGFCKRRGRLNLCWWIRSGPCANGCRIRANPLGLRIHANHESAAQM